MTTYQNESNSWVEISCDSCDEEVLEQDFHDAKDVIDSLGWKTFKDTDGEWAHKCSACIDAESEDFADTLMDRYTP